MPLVWRSRAVRATAYQRRGTLFQGIYLLERKTSTTALFQLLLKRR